jgi:uncharacterized protein YjbI with pentapeptide repeats
MSDHDLLEELENAIRQVINSETDDFFELAKITRLNPLTDFAGANISEVNLSGKNLRDANLNGSDLSRANLNGANLCGANLNGANLNGANLNGANLNGANLNGANLNGANLCGANLCGANLCGANLNGADLNGANLNEADFNGADLNGANLNGANLNEADFNGADLNGVKSKNFKTISYGSSSLSEDRAVVSQASLRSSRETIFEGKLLHQTQENIKFRNNHAISFFDITVDRSNARDLVFHEGPIISPSDSEQGYWQFYMHSHQESNLLALSGGRTFYLVNFSWIKPFHIVRLEANGDILQIPPGTFYRSISDIGGSLVLNQAVRDNVNLASGYQVYDSSKISRLLRVISKQPKPLPETNPDLMSAFDLSRSNNGEFDMSSEGMNFITEYPVSVGDSLEVFVLESMFKLLKTA